MTARANPDVAAERLAALRSWSAGQARSQQKRVGMSEIGGCSRALAHRLLGTQTLNHDTQVMASLRGTAIHSMLEDAIPASLFPDRKVMTEVEVHYAGLQGHVDLVVDGVVEDAKTKDKDGMAAVRRYGPNQSHIWQIHLYAAALREADHDIHTVRLTYYTVSSPDDVHVIEMPYEQAITDAAIRHYWNVLDAVHRIEQTGNASHLPAPEKDAATWCKPYCRFYNPDAVEAGVGCPGRSDKPSTYTEVTLGEMWGDATPNVAALQDYRRGMSLTAEGDALKKAAREKLLGARGVAGGISVGWTNPQPKEEVDVDRALMRLAALGEDIPMMTAQRASSIQVKEVS